MDSQDPPLPSKWLSVIFLKLLKEVRIALRKVCEKEGFELQDLACTLLVVVATPRWLTAAQVGDGFIVARGEDGIYKLIFPPVRGEFANETVFVTTPKIGDALQVAVEEPASFICASSDGLEAVALKRESWSPFPGFFQPLEECIKTLDSIQAESYLKEFLDSDRLRSRTDDDLTLALGFWDPS
ncbi:MAG: protein phosphatase 2C domain-containing protein [Synechococcaceae cyanobacterium SM2_3_2]|nr:protein phosphatase 2C domain-containing protein [Synechococcaceae cyanobacterium SM2_3_2]